MYRLTFHDNETGLHLTASSNNSVAVVGDLLSKIGREFGCRDCGADVISDLLETVGTVFVRADDEDVDDVALSLPMDELSWVELSVIGRPAAV